MYSLLSSQFEDAFALNHVCHGVLCEVELQDQVHRKINNYYHDYEHINYTQRYKLDECHVTLTLYKSIKSLLCLSNNHKVDQSKVISLLNWMH